MGKTDGHVSKLNGYSTASLEASLKILVEDEARRGLTSQNFWSLYQKTYRMSKPRVKTSRPSIGQSVKLYL